MAYLSNDVIKQIIGVDLDQGHPVRSAQPALRSVALLLPLESLPSTEELHRARVLGSLVLDCDVSPAEHHVEGLWCQPRWPYLVVDSLVGERSA
ncbi:hypothetical protein [Curtobacterium sp. MCLR17_054]|uniref:hypothetical protein n=1 Tax=Curtobacterium sp. MCLR17_054 TaxID=2175632 RepID=UPI0011B4FC33|nr:hypothetical protein [Curtobacterium sp. MCLR17_054]WIE68473.1 hypothetical protein DEJ08_000505 [Curtobacterium sp. MCLR17_054]